MGSNFKVRDKNTRRAKNFYIFQDPKNNIYKYYVRDHVYAFGYGKRCKRIFVLEIKIDKSSCTLHPHPLVTVM